MKNKIIFLFFILSSCLYGQGNKFTISGVVTDCKTKESIAGVVIKLVGSDGSSIETTTDNTGHYLFDSKKVNKDRRYVVTTQVGNDVRNEKTKWGYLNCSDKVKLSTYDTVKTKDLSIDFCLAPSRGCTFGPPLIYFKKNTADFYNTISIKDTILFIYQILMDNPNLVFEISGNASKDEKKPDMLALKRAELIRQLLINKGIEEDRLVTKSNSNTNPYEYMDYDGQIIIENKSNETSYQKNRRVVFSVIRRDYVPKNPPQEQPKNNTEIEEGE